MRIARPSRLEFFVQSKPNPFSTRFVRPGAIAYRRTDGRSLHDLAEEFFDRCHGWASIVGPHGSGKSTLLVGLKDCFEERCKVFAYRFSTSDRNFQSLWKQRSQWAQGNLVIVDGYEQLTVWSRWRLRSSVRIRRANLLVTAHQIFQAFPVLWTTSVEETLAKQLRDSLLELHPELLDAPDLEAAWREARERYPSDLRETLMSMYDWAEEQKQKRLASHDNSRAV